MSRVFVSRFNVVCFFRPPGECHFFATGGGGERKKKEKRKRGKREESGCGCLGESFVRGSFKGRRALNRVSAVERSAFLCKVTRRTKASSPPPCSFSLSLSIRALCTLQFPRRLLRPVKGVGDAFIKRNCAEPD